MIDYISNLFENLIDLLHQIGDGFVDLMSAGHEFLTYIGTYANQIKNFLTNWIPTPFLVIAIACIGIDILFIILGANHS